MSGRGGGERGIGHMDALERYRGRERKRQTETHTHTNTHTHWERCAG